MVVSSVPPMIAGSSSVRLVRDGRHQVGAVVHGHVRLVVERRLDVLVVGVVVLALDGVDGDTVIAYQASGHIVLGGERV